MSAEKETAQLAATPEAQLFISLVALMVFGTIGRILVSDEPFDWRRLTGELILAAIGAVLLHAFGMLNGMNFYQIIAIGALGGLGGVRLLEWLIKIWKQVRVQP